MNDKEYLPEIAAMVTDETALIVVSIDAKQPVGGAENESESWATVSEWALRHRRAGRLAS